MVPTSCRPISTRWFSPSCPVNAAMALSFNVAHAVTTPDVRGEARGSEARIQPSHDRSPARPAGNAATRVVDVLLGSVIFAHLIDELRRRFDQADARV